MSFEERVKKITPKLKAIAYKLGHYSEVFSQNDLFQEALFYLWTEFRQGRLEGNTDSYILQGSYFYLKNYLRKHGNRAKIVSIDDLMSEEGLSLQEIFCPKDYKPKQEIKELDNRMLVDKIRNNGLTSREKQVFLLWLEGLTTREIGNRLAISHVRVVKLQNSIKEKCQKYKN